MRGTALYDEDILLWSEQQAGVIRRLGRTRPDLSNELDVENVAEEVESVGRSELAAVESQLQNILFHLMKMAVEPDANATRHWRVEVAACHGEMRRRYTPSMRQRIDILQLWRLARDLSVLGAEFPDALEEALPGRPPFQLDDLLMDQIDSLALAKRIQEAAALRS